MPGTPSNATRPRLRVSCALWLLLMAVGGLTRTAPNPATPAEEHASDGRPHILSAVGSVLVISGSRSGERAAAMARRFADLGGGSADAPAPPMTLFQGASGAALARRVPTPSLEHAGPDLARPDAGPGELSFVDGESGLGVRLWDWTEAGVGGAGMDERTVARITACALSHILAARRALRDDRWPALIVEDDVTFAPLLEQPGGGTALAGALAAATAQAAAMAAAARDMQTSRGYHATSGGARQDGQVSSPSPLPGPPPLGEWGIVQVGYLIPSAALAAEGLSFGSTVRPRDACSAHFHMVGIQVL